MKKISILLVAILFGTVGSIQAQSLSVAGQLGWAIPMGSSFDGAETSGGLSVGVDVLYFFPNNLNKLGVGVEYSGNLLFGSNDYGLSTLSLYAVKGYYKFLDGKFTPFAALSLGLAQYGTPDYTVGGETTKGITASAFGIAPEIGIQYGGLFLSGKFLIPMKYSYEGTTFETSAGALSINIGYRFTFGL